MTSDAWDVLHRPAASDAHWTTDNIGEAVPGCLSPCMASIMDGVGNRMMREVAFAMGVFSRRERTEWPDVLRPFHARLAMRLEYLAAVGDRMPGISGREAVASLHGRVPDTMHFAPTRRRYPVIAAKLPYAMLTTPRAIYALAAETDPWWRHSVRSLQTLTSDDARALAAEGLRRYEQTLTVHSIGALAVIQPLLVELTKFVEMAGIGDVGELSGGGGAEMAIITDLWSASRGRLSIAEVADRHGFHGPLEGEVASRVWREDPGPLERLIAGYSERPDSDDPTLREARNRAALPSRQRELIAALPRAQRPRAQIVLRRAARLLPLRGVGKRSFLQSLDVVRSGVRRFGELNDFDPFCLTINEITGTVPGDAAALAARRAGRRALHQRVTLPSAWRGTPPTATAVGEGTEDVVAGIGVSAGTVEGTVRVITDPAFPDVEPGEVLVTPTTDPSWASIMYISAALVVDIGGPFSHAAMIAREIGIPCVVNTRTGSRTLQTGERVRVDGRTGLVERLDRVPAAGA